MITRTVRKAANLVNSVASRINSAVRGESSASRPAVPPGASLVSPDRSAKFVKRLPLYVNANNITAARTCLVFPTLISLSHGHTFFPVACIAVNAVFDYVDGYVARIEKNDPERLLAMSKPRRERARSRHPGNIECSFTASERTRRLCESWGAYFDAVSDKAFMIPVWISLVNKTSHSPELQLVLISLCCVEGFSAYVRTKMYFTQPLFMPKPPEARVSTAWQPKASKVLAEGVGKVKYFVSVVGTVCVVVLPKSLEMVGALALGLCIPLALTSVFRKVDERTVLADLSSRLSIFEGKCAGGEKNLLSAVELQFIEAAKSLGGRLIVRVPSMRAGSGSEEEESSQILFPNAIEEALRVLPSVDELMMEKPSPSGC